MRHDAIINGVAFAKDICASWGEDGYVRLWDPKSGIRDYVEWALSAPMRLAK